MRPVFSRAEMRAFDAHAIEKCHIPSLVLMENAGRGSAGILVSETLGGAATESRVVVVCGGGNNGGDGLVIARHLLVRGASPLVVMTGDVNRLTPDARANYEAWRGLGGETHLLPTGGEVATLAEAASRAKVIVDALFGTGLDRPIGGWLAEVVRAMNASGRPCFSVDLPSGLDADTGATLGVAVQACATATFAHPKLGLLTPNGAKLAGRLHVIDIGVPSSLVDVSKSARLIESTDLAGWVVPRAPGAHKSSAGHVVVVGGSLGKVGAPQLVAHGALRGGAGLATIATWPDAASTIESHVLEAMTARIDPSRVGEGLDAILIGKQAVVIGPGFGLGGEAQAAVEHVLASWHGPTVIDADALSMFAGRVHALATAKKAILTPHPGELARLLGKTTAEIENNRFRAALDAVAATKAVVVLKGAHTIVASPDSPPAVTPIACPALATAGAGDVLAGMVAAMACSLPPFQAACAAVMAHALAGERWSRTHAGADRGMLASEIADIVPEVLRTTATGPHRAATT